MAFTVEPLETWCLEDIDTWCSDTLDPILISPTTANFIVDWGNTHGVDHYYRVTSQAASNDSPPFTDTVDQFGSQGSVIVTMILASSLTEVVQKLIDKAWTSPIVQVVRFDPPAFYSEWPPGTPSNDRTVTDVTADFNRIIQSFGPFYDVDVDVNSDFTKSLRMVATITTTTVLGYIPSGELRLGGTAGWGKPTQPSSSFYQPSGGGFSLGGGLPQSVPSIFFHQSSGGGFKLGGGQLTIVRLLPPPVFAPPVELTGQDQVVIACCPSTVAHVSFRLEHNLNQTKSLGAFLTRNNLTLPSNLVLTFKQATQTWQKSLYYYGIGVNSNSTQKNQKWNLYFEFGCSYSDYAWSLGDYWKFAMKVQSQDLTLGTTTQTNLVLFFDPSLICLGVAPIDFDFSFNVLTGLATPSTNIVPAFYDNLGLFKSSSWANNPFFKVNLSADVISPTQTVSYRSQKSR